MDIQDVSQRLKEGQIGVLPTDTLYGIHGLALKKDVVERIYALRKRELHKPFIVLIGDINDLEKFGVKLNDKQRKFLDIVWPGKISAILPCDSESCTYIHRGLASIAFRIPSNEKLRAILRLTGPLVSTSVNPAGEEPAKTIQEAKDYFGDRIDFYEDAGIQDSPPSTLVRLINGTTEILREGAVKINTKESK